MELISTIVIVTYHIRSLKILRVKMLQNSKSYCSWIIFSWLCCRTFFKARIFAGALKSTKNSSLQILNYMVFFWYFQLLLGSVIMYWDCGKISVSPAPVCMSQSNVTLPPLLYSRLINNKNSTVRICHIRDN